VGADGLRRHPLGIQANWRRWVMIWRICLCQTKGLEYFFFVRFGLLDQRPDNFLTLRGDAHMRHPPVFGLGRALHMAQCLHAIEQTGHGGLLGQ
jgi:hypothetical protein